MPGATSILTTHPIVAEPSARGRNHLLGGLSARDRSLIAADMRTVVIAPDTVILIPDATIDQVYFPETGLVAIEEPVAAAAHVEVALVGSEGLVGWPAVLGDRPRGTHRAIVRGAEATLRVLDAAVLLAACRASGTLWAALLAFVEAVTVQMSRAIAAHLESPLDQRIARWLLMRHDRIAGDHIVARHDEIADALNARRASVTDRLHVIEGERLIRNRRGRIIIVDRPGLERFAGASFGIAEAGYRRLLGPFGKS